MAGLDSRAADASTGCSGSISWRYVSSAWRSSFYCAERDWRSRSLLARRKMSVGDFAAKVGITPANIAVLKNGRARAIRLTTLDSVFRVLDCQPGDILRWTADPRSRGGR